MATVELADAPATAKTYIEKGMAAQERNNLAYAMDMFEAALHIEPKLHEVRKMLRTAAMRETKTNPPGKIAKARIKGTALRIAAQLKKNPLRALADAESLLRTDPLNMRSIKIHCDAAKAAGLPEVAIQSLELLLETAPRTPDALKLLASLYREDGSVEREYACWKTLAEVIPFNAAVQKELKDSAARLALNQKGWSSG